MPKLTKLNFFFGSKNSRAIELALKLGAKERKWNSILVLEKSRTEKVPRLFLPELSPSHVEEFKKLHNTLFPSAYFSGQEIIDSVDEHHKVLTLEDGKNLVGYIHIEAVPEHREGTIHFFGVKDVHREKGYGQQLLAAGINFAFSIGGIAEISLCVDTHSENAIRLYKKLGFVERRKCLHLTLDIKNSSGAESRL